MSSLLHRTNDFSQPVALIHFAVLLLLVLMPCTAVAGQLGKSIPNAAELEMADDADNRGFGNVNLIYAGDGFNIYLPDKPYFDDSTSSARVLVIHQVADDEPIVKSRPKPDDDRSAAFQYYDDAYIEQLLQLVAKNSELKPNFPRAVHLIIDFYHFVRGKRRQYPENPDYELAFVCGNGRLRIPENRYVPPSMIIACGTGLGSYLTVAETLKQDEPTVQSWAKIREGWRLKEEAAAEKVRRREEGEKTHGFLKVGALPWDGYRHGKLLENMFRGAFDKIPSSTAKGQADLYYLYQKYVFTYEEKCASHLPPDAVRTQTVTVKRSDGIEVDREYSGVTLVHPELADAFVHYGNHPAGANLSAVAAVLRGGVGSVLSEQAAWERDMVRFLAAEECNGKAVRQLQQNMSRFHGNRPSLQAEAGVL